MAKMTPEQEAAYALDWNLDRSSLKAEVQLHYDRLKAERATRRTAAPPPPEPEPRFPSTPQVRRVILESIAAKNDKYARPFDRGKVAMMSLVGTESWSDYGAVVLQMATLDTLISIEEKLSELLQRLDGSPSMQAD